ncbi:cobalamin-independent methionine synthase II family protein [Pseudonocardia benzenivorans]|jgi:5-methyltetrahydropteroyltriglutamate--homocysteine methyltransferase|uniref:Methionine synthase vitamin-B12 independent n=2 Tax=Pseudonocardia TaxID=1847 RepID=F4CZ32_PSEUX|nr:cobalamin-independent methionine synthase II family protein [Pseudonocardia dioxanivorans]AEA24736.1 Methionine synthase vitamin-B12 independent [Pseudonocardia dioxanivorans CB1190]GJF01256.1 methionine synthase [Pseudonocardia sp. D17]
MQRSDDRILTTHVGSLARPRDLLEAMREKEHGRPYDVDGYAKRVTAAVDEVVREQVSAGIDVVTDGEMSKVSFLTYVKDRLTGFDTGTGEKLMPPSWQVEIDAFPEYYADYLGKYKDQVSPMTTMVCTGPVSYDGHAQLRTDVENLRAAIAAAGPVTEAFLPSTSPSGFGRNEYYPSHGDYLTAVAEALREEYLAIVDAGFLLQVDDPWLIEYLSENPATTPEQRVRDAEQHIEILNHALRGIPQEKIRLHTCYGLNHGPRIHDLAFRDIAPLMLKVNAGAYSFEVANPRHQHEWKIWRDVTLPEGKVLIPGLLGHASNYVEHPELIADTIELYAGIVGKENVIAGADCGFSSRASFHPEVHPTVVWEKFRALAEGARLATERMY